MGSDTIDAVRVGSTMGSDTMVAWSPDTNKKRGCSCEQPRRISPEERNYIFLGASAAGAAGAATAVVSFFVESIIAGAPSIAGAAAGAAAAVSAAGASSFFAPQAARTSIAANVAKRFIGKSPGISGVVATEASVRRARRTEAR